MSKFSKVASAGLFVMASSGGAGAAECAVFDIPFPTVSQVSRTVGGACGSAGNSADGTGLYSTPGDPNTKAVAGRKKQGSQTSFVNGVDASNVPISRCGVSVNNPADGVKRDITGCAAAVKVRLRMFD